MVRTPLVAVMPISDSGFHNIGHDTDPIHVISIDVSPVPPRPGEDMTVTASGIANEEIEVGLVSCYQECKASRVYF